MLESCQHDDARNDLQMACKYDGFSISMWGFSFVLGYNRGVISMDERITTIFTIAWLVSLVLVALALPTTKLNPTVGAILFWVGAFGASTCGWIGALNSTLWGAGFKAVLDKLVKGLG